MRRVLRTYLMKLIYDVIVVGAGHAGCEAACASAGMGAKTCLITMDMNKIAQMSCNPAVGGIAKGQIVREIDALGGHMGEITDRTAIQFRMLNRSKGPAMWSPRAQCDRSKFIWAWRETLDNTPNLSIWQDQVTELITSHEGTARNAVAGVRTIWGMEIMAKSVIITAGTFLNGLMHIGRNKLEGGRCSEPAAKLLTESIASNGIRVGRMKTGTPVRIDGRSVHFEDMTEQPGDEACGRFSYMGDDRKLPQLPCWITYTNEAVHARLREGLEDSPLFNGQIQSIGPRYCPSIETKLVTFAGKDSHLLFLEPEGVNTQEYYLNGFSSSLPIETQIEALKLIPRGRAISCRSGQRHNRIRGGSRTRPDSRHERRTQATRQGTVHTAPRRGIYRCIDRRYRHKRSGRTLPHVYLTCRVPHPAPPGRRRCTAYRKEL